MVCIRISETIWSCYKKAKTTYDELLNEMLDAEWEKFTEVKTTSLKVKSAMTTLEDREIKDLKQKIDQFTMVVKSSTFVGTKPKKGNAGITNVASGQYTGKDNSKKPTSPYKGQGPTTSAAGPFKNGQKPYQCYNCGGWGHSYRQCSSQGGIDWRSLSRAELPPKKRERLQGQQQTVNGVIERTKEGGESRYHNPDPLHRLIGPRN